MSTELATLFMKKGIYLRASVLFLQDWKRAGAIGEDIAEGPPKKKRISQFLTGCLLLLPECTHLVTFPHVLT